MNRETQSKAATVAAAILGAPLEPELATHDHKGAVIPGPRPEPHGYGHADDSALRYEKALADRAELERLRHEERGEGLSLEQELRLVANSTSVAPLRDRRLAEVLKRRSAECSLSFVLAHEDSFGELVLNFMRGWSFNPRAEMPMPDPTLTAARPIVRLRRVDADADGRYAPFVYVFERRSDLPPGEERRLTAGWIASNYSGCDPTQIWREIVPDPQNGAFELSIHEALKVLRAFKDTSVRSRNRRTGTADKHPLVCEDLAAAAYVPVEPTRVPS